MGRQAQSGQVSPSNGDANSQYDFYGDHVNRLISTLGVVSPTGYGKITEQDVLNQFALGDPGALPVPNANWARARRQGRRWPSCSDDLFFQWEGLEAASKKSLTLGNYQEIRLRHFEQAIDRYVAMPPLETDWRAQQKCGRR